MIEHRNVIGLFLNDRFQYDFSSADIWLQFHSCCFDFSVLKSVAPFYSEESSLWLGTINLTIWASAYSLYNEELQFFARQPQSFTDSAISCWLRAKLSIRYFILGGEAITPRLLFPMKSKYQDAKFINIYGPD
jgi:non-ribosomal peptide synthetase component F